MSNLGKCRIIFFLFRSKPKTDEKEASQRTENVWDQSKIKSLSRKFNLDLAPKVDEAFFAISTVIHSALIMRNSFFFSFYFHAVLWWIF